MSDYDSSSGFDIKVNYTVCGLQIPHKNFHSLCFFHLGLETNMGTWPHCAGFTPGTVWRRAHAVWKFAVKKEAYVWFQATVTLAKTSRSITPKKKYSKKKYRKKLQANKDVLLDNDKASGMTASQVTTLSAFCMSSQTKDCAVSSYSKVASVLEASSLLLKGGRQCTHSICEKFPGDWIQVSVTCPWLEASRSILFEDIWGTK